MNPSSELYWSTREFLRSHQLFTWNDLPLWAPISDDYFIQISNAKALKVGFTYTPIEKTINDCPAWYSEQGNEKIVFGAGEDPEGPDRSKELNVIAALKEVE